MRGDNEPFLLQNGRDSPAALPTPEPTQQAASCQSVAVATLQEETMALRAEIASLQAQLAHFKSQNQTGNQRQTTGSDSPRRELRVSGDDSRDPIIISIYIYNASIFKLIKRMKLIGTDQTPLSFIPLFCSPVNHLVFPQTRGNTSSPEPLTAPCSPLLPPLQTPPTKSVTREELPVLKMAERVRLRRTDERHITGPDITNLGVRFLKRFFSLYLLLEGRAITMDRFCFRCAPPWSPSISCRISWSSRTCRS